MRDAGWPRRCCGGLPCVGGVRDRCRGTEVCRQVGREAELAGRPRGDQIRQGLAFHRGHQAPVNHDAVVTGRQRPGHGAHLLAGEPVGVALMGVDHDLQLGDTRRPGGGCAHLGPGLAAGARRLPEHRLAAPRPRVDDLRAVLPSPVQHQIDRRAPPAARAHRRALHHVGMLRPLAGRHRIAVQGLGARPRARGAEQKATLEGHQQQESEPRVRVRVAGDHQLHPVDCCGQRDGHRTPPP
jgi:hypothetical protein